MSRKNLTLDGLDDFQPRRQAPSQAVASTEQVPGMGWSRREASDESQFTIRARVDTIERFKKMCRPVGGGRFTYGEMLDRLMEQAGEQD